MEIQWVYLFVLLHKPGAYFTLYKEYLPFIIIKTI